ncbi:MAG TPA: alpha/beta hydrolase-fold protein [Mucilaginibacter sp.]
MKITHHLTNSLICLCILAAFSACKRAAKPLNVTKREGEGFTLFSKTVKDTFYISIQLPLDYRAQSKKRYSVVVVTDANFYYPMIAPILHQYEKGGLLPPLILVGIGYNSFKLMDSLRVRDYMYPKAIPSDEMKAVGGGQHFYQFITNELLPKVDSTYRTETNNRTLLGHSFGGYFSLYALMEQVDQKRNDFKGFVSASPSLWYNNYYLFQIPQKLKTLTRKDTLNLFLSVGGLEEPKWSIQPVKDLSKKFSDEGLNNMKVNTEIFNDLDHMDVGLISFVRGLEKMYVQN